jgi:hypothetical protein
MKDNMKYLFLSDYDPVGQSDVAPTKTDFVVNENCRFFEFDEERKEYREISEEAITPLPQDDSGCDYLYVDTVSRDAWQSSIKPDDDDLLDAIADHVLYVFKCEGGKFFAMDDEGDWNKVIRLEIGDCSHGEYHIFS